MKNSAVLLLLALSLGLTSCIETLEEVFFNRNGSGVYTMTLDMSELLANPMMKGMIEEAAKEEGAAASAMLSDIDTLISLGADAPAGSPLQKGELSMKINQDKGDFLMKISFPFEETEEISTFFTALSEQGQSLGGISAGLGGAGILNPGGLFSWKRNKLYREAKADEGQAEMLEGEDGQFMKMFLGSASHKTVYHFPGKVKHTDIPDAVVDGKTLTIERSLLDLMAGEAGLEGTIKFRRR